MGDGATAVERSNPRTVGRVSEPPQVDDTSCCPVARCCEACESVEDVMVVTAAAPTGVLCVTLCLPCIADAAAPRLSLVEVCTRVMLHCCAHVGIAPEDLTAFGSVLDDHRGRSRSERF